MYPIAYRIIYVSDENIELRRTKNVSDFFCVSFIDLS